MGTACSGRGWGQEGAGKEWVRGPAHLALGRPEHSGDAHVADHVHGPQGGRTTLALLTQHNAHTNIHVHAHKP